MSVRWKVYFVGLAATAIAVRISSGPEPALAVAGIFFVAAAFVGPLTGGFKK